MITMETIKDGYKQFSKFLNTIDLSELRKIYSRKELEVLEKQLRAINIRSLPYELSELTEEMKTEEFPELLGVHNYPEIREIDFLDEEEKLELDNFLVRFRVGNYIAGFFAITHCQDKLCKIGNFLIANRIVEKSYAVCCPHCGDGYISEFISEDIKDALDRAITFSDYSVLEKHLSYVCDECEIDYDIERLKELDYKSVFVLLKERDDSLDNA